MTKKCNAKFFCRARPLITVACLLLIPVGPLAAGIFKWVDDNGKVHYGDRPGGADAEPVQVNTTPPADSARQKRNQRRDKLLKIYQEERSERKGIAEKQRAASKKRKANCAKARNIAGAYDGVGRIYDEGENGERAYLDEAAVSAEKQRALQAVADWCD